MEEALEFSLEFTMIGMLIVFAALAIIVGAISLIRKADSSWQEREDRQYQQALEKDQTIDNITLILIAATAATMIKGRFYIRSVRRLMPVGSPGGSWSLQGRAVLHGSHVVPKKR